MTSKKKRNTNANTAHSIALRQKTSREWQQNITRENRFEFKSADPELIAAIREGFRKIEGRSNAEKTMMLLNFHQENKELVATIQNLLQEINGTSDIEKVLMLWDFYRKNSMS